MNWLKNIFSSITIQRVVVVPCRNYEKKPYVRRYGYKDKILMTGLLPRLKDADRVKTMPTYRPKNSWSEKRALFGQNDYIDILGDGTVHPSQLLTEIPRWLRGFKGNEFQVLQRRLKHRGDYYENIKPKKFDDMRKRYRHLYRYLNFKTNSAR